MFIVLKVKTRWIPHSTVSGEHCSVYDAYTSEGEGESKKVSA